ERLVRVSNDFIAADRPDEEAAIRKCQLKLRREALQARAARPRRSNILDQPDREVQQADPRRRIARAQILTRVRQHARRHAIHLTTSPSARSVHLKIVTVADPKFVTAERVAARARSSDVSRVGGFDESPRFAIRDLRRHVARLHDVWWTSSSDRAR